MRRGIIFHLHIPKNAGTTLSRMLKIRLLLTNPARILHHDRVLGYYTIRRGTGSDELRLERISSLGRRVAAQVRFFEAHCGFGVADRLPGPSITVTMLRDPVDRTLSVFDFRVQQGRLDPSTPLRDWLTREPDMPVWHVDNGQLRYLAGQRGALVDAPVGRCTRAMLDEACARVGRDDVIAGLVERFDETTLVLEHALGLGPLRWARSNQTAQRTRARDLDPRDRDFLAERLELDRALVEHARAVHDRRLADVLSSDSGGLERVRAQSRSYSRWMGWFNARVYGARRAAQRLGIGRS